MPNLVIYTNPLTPGTAQMPVFVNGDNPNWGIQFNNGTNFYSPAGVMMKIGFINGLPDATYANAFRWVDRMNNVHQGSFVMSGGLANSLTWDENPINVFGNNGAFLIRGRVPPSGSIRKVYIKYGGAGLSSTPLLRFNSGANPTGFGGLIASLTGLTGAITIPAILNPGYNYSVIPEILVSGDGTGGAVKATLTNGQISALSVVAGGSGYTHASFTVRDPEASAAASTIGSSSVVTGLVLTNPGSGYTSAPTPAFSPASTTAATAALLNATWGLSGLTLTGAGSGYTTPPLISFSGGTGSGATATAIIEPYQQIVSITPDTTVSYADPSLFSISVTGGGGSGVKVLPIFSSQNIYWNYTLLGIQIVSGGSGYTSTPTVNINGSLSGSITGTARVGAGIVTALVLTNPGSGYGATAPNVVFSSGTASATAQLLGSPISPVLTITNAGSGYTAAPVVSFSGGSGSGAAATAQISLGITAVTMSQTGYAYSALPSISCIPDSGAVLIPEGIETHASAFLQDYNPPSAQQAITATPYSSGRTDTSGNLIYDDSLLIIRPNVIIQPTLTLQSDGLTWAGVFTPVNAFVLAVLSLRRSLVADVEIFGDGRLLYSGSLTISAD